MMHHTVCIGIYIATMRRKMIKSSSHKDDEMNQLNKVQEMIQGGIETTRID